MRNKNKYNLSSVHNKTEGATVESVNGGTYKISSVHDETESATVESVNDATYNAESLQLNQGGYYFLLEMQQTRSEIYATIGGVLSEDLPEASTQIEAASTPNGIAGTTMTIAHQGLLHKAPKEMSSEYKKQELSLCDLEQERANNRKLFIGFPKH